MKSPFINCEEFFYQMNKSLALHLFCKWINPFIKWIDPFIKWIKLLHYISSVKVIFARWWIFKDGDRYLKEQDWVFQWSGPCSLHHSKILISKLWWTWWRQKLWSESGSQGINEASKICFFFFLILEETSTSGRVDDVSQNPLLEKK